MFNWLRPKDDLTEQDVNFGLKMLLFDGICSQTMVVLALGPFLVAFAVLLGASNLVIGMIGAIGPLCQILQIPSVFLVEHFRLRKAVTLATVVTSRLAWLGIAAVPFVLAQRYWVLAFLLFLLAFHGINAVATCGFNSWVRDVIPENVMGGFFGKRMAWATAIGIAITLAAGLGVEVCRSMFGAEMQAYSGLYVLGAVSGLVGAYYLARIAEPRMYAEAERGILMTLREPFGDPNYMRFLYFLGVWSFGVNFSGPFFAVYILKRLGLTVGWLVGLSVVSQIVNLLFFGLWGKLADRFSNKSVLVATMPMLIACYLLWPLTTAPNPYLLTIPILIAVHVIGGIATAGVMLAANNLTLKTAPRGKATAYLATSALVGGLVGSIAPMLAGLAADTLEHHELNLTLNWTYSGAEPMGFTLPSLDLKGLDFIFVFSAVFLVYALHRLLAVREEGEVETAVVRREFLSEVQRRIRQVSTIAGLRFFGDFAYSKLVQMSVLKKSAESNDMPELRE